MAPRRAPSRRWYPRAHGKHDDVAGHRRCASPISTTGCRSRRPIPRPNRRCSGAILINNMAHGRVAEFLLPEHFGNAVHGRIYAAIGKLIERGQIANPVTLKNLFDQDGALAEIGGAQYLARLAEAAVTIINAEHYGRTIHDLHLRRELITIGQDVVTDAFQPRSRRSRDRADRARRSETVRAGDDRAGGGRVPAVHDGAGRTRSRWRRPPSSATARPSGWRPGLPISTRSSAGCTPPTW